MGKMICLFLKRNTTLSPMTKNRLRTSCAPAVVRGDFKKLKTEEGAVQPITAAIWFRFASPKFLLHCVPQKLHIAAERYE